MLLYTSPGAVSLTQCFFKGIEWSISVDFLIPDPNVQKMASRTCVTAARHRTVSVRIMTPPNKQVKQWILASGIS